MSANIEDPALLDTAFLGKYTLGDRMLEREVLQMFIDQTDLYLTRLQSPQSTKDWREAAHSLKGSARGIGAFRVGMRAAQLEQIAEPLLESSRCAILALLREDLDETKAAISDHVKDKSDTFFV